MNFANRTYPQVKTYLCVFLFSFFALQAVAEGRGSEDSKFSYGYYSETMFSRSHELGLFENYHTDHILAVTYKLDENQKLGIGQWFVSKKCRKGAGDPVKADDTCRADKATKDFSLNGTHVQYHRLNLLSLWDMNISGRLRVVLPTSDHDHLTTQFRSDFFFRRDLPHSLKLSGFLNQRLYVSFKDSAGQNRARIWNHVQVDRSLTDMLGMMVSIGTYDNWRHEKKAAGPSLIIPEGEAIPALEGEAVGGESASVAAAMGAPQHYVYWSVGASAMPSKGFSVKFYASQAMPYEKMRLYDEKNLTYWLEVSKSL